MEINRTKEPVLVVDDDQKICELLTELLGALGFPTSCANSAREALDRLKRQSCTFLIVDMKMPDMDGMQLIRRAKERHPGLSVIAITAYTEEYKYMDIINSGATDFVKKPIDIAELEAKILRCINERDLRRELSRLSITDSLTGLFNQRHFYRRLKEELVRCARQKHSLALILLDIDNFKGYNDRYGHIAGDEALKQVGKAILRSIRDGVDLGFRYGGDEFAVLLIDSDSAAAREIGSRVQSAIQERSEIKASIGYAVYSEGMTETELVALADADLYKSKR